jgi:CRP-like cAMP-binding protein
MGAFEEFVPRLASGTEMFSRSDGSAVLLLAHRALEVAADQAFLLKLMDGKRSLAEISAEHYQQHKFIPFQAMVDLLSTLRTQELLANGLSEMDQAGILILRSTSPGRGILLGRLSIPRGLSGLLGVLAFLAVVGWIAAFLTGRVRPPSGLHPGILGPGNSPLYGLGLALAGVSAAVTMRSLLRSGAAALAGAPIRSLELRLRGVAPMLELEGGPIPVLERGPRIACYLLAMAGTWVTALAAGSLLPAAVSPAVTLGAMIAGFIDLCPFAPTSLGHLLAVVAGRVDLRDHARSYLSRRLLAPRAKRGLFAGERVILATTGLSVIWCAVAVFLAAIGVPPSVMVLMESGIQLGALEAAAAGIYMLVLVGGSMVALGLLVRLVLSAVASARPASLREQGPSFRVPLTESSSALRQVKLFAGLPAPVLAALGKEAHQVNFEPESVIIAQGATSERFYGIVEGIVQVVREAETGLERRVTELGAGDCFGETALLSPAPSVATYKSEGVVIGLEVSREGFQRVVAAAPGEDLTRLIRAAAALHRNPLLSRMAPERIASLVPKLLPVQIEAGKNAVTRGEVGDSFYIVDHGELEVLDAHERAIAKLSDGDYFGEIALLRNVPRTATVRAIKPTSLWSLSKADFFGVLSRDLALSQAVEGQALARVLGRRHGESHGTPPNVLRR